MSDAMKETSDLTGICTGGVLEVRDGQYVLPVPSGHSGIEALALDAARTRYPDTVARFGTLPQQAAGLLVRIPDGMQVSEPLCLSFTGTGGCTVAVHAGRGATAELLFLLADGAALRRHIVAENGSSLRIREVAAGGADGMLSVASTMQVGEGARVDTVTVELGGGRAELHYATVLEGASAEALHAGLFMAADGERKEVDVRVEHLVPDCRSDVLMKGVASGTGFGSFGGMVYVAQDAQRTVAYQQSRNLVLGGRARIVTAPQLEIYADDVRCSHGATVGQMDDEAVYYMRQRGLSEAEARGLQLTGFVNEVVSRLGDGPLAEEVLRRAGRKIAALQQSA